MNNYTVYFSNILGLNHPKDGIFTALVEEVIIKLLLKNPKKTNEFYDEVTSNCKGHTDIFWNGHRLDVKRINARYNSITLSSDELDKDIVITVIVTEGDTDYLTLNHIRTLRNIGRDKQTYRIIPASELIRLGKSTGNLGSMSKEISNIYHELLDCFDKIPEIPSIPKYSDISKFREAADTVLKYLRPVFQKVFGLNPVVEFI